MITEEDIPIVPSCGNASCYCFHEAYYIVGEGREDAARLYNSGKKEFIEDRFCPTCDGRIIRGTYCGHHETLEALRHCALLHIME